MSKNLFSKKNDLILNLIDWHPLINKLSQLFKFNKNISKVDSIFDKNKKIDQELELNSISYFQNQLHSSVEKFNLYSKFFSSDFDPILFLKKANKDEILDLSKINSLCHLINFYKISETDLTKNWIKNKLFIVTSEKINQLTRELLKPFRSFVEPDGTVYYERHPLLKAIYIQIKNEEKQIKLILKNILNSDKFINSLQYNAFDTINDRYVVPISSDSYSHALGKIISRSASGKTLLIEPNEISHLNNKRIELLNLLEKKILQISKMFCETIKSYTSEFSIMAQFIFEVDFSLSKSLFCYENKFSKPNISEKSSIHLEGFFHPLIPDPVKNDIKLNEDKAGLVISGPNTGGKTVTLKSIALCHIFYKLGFFVPCQDSSIFDFDGIYYFSHDHQDLQQGLSSFSSEVNNYIDLLKELKSNKSNIIFIDEIFNSTSSEEASSLALSLLSEIGNSPNTKVIISTHHQFLKTFIHNDSNYISSHVGFDFNKNIPNYKLQIGTPGSSMALSIFRNISKKKGYSKDLYLRAKNILDKKQISYENLLNKLSKQKLELNQLILKNKEINQELNNQKDSIKGVLYLEKDKEISKFKSKIQNTLIKSEKLLDKINKREIISKKQLYKESSRIKEELHEHIQSVNIPKKEHNPSKVFKSISIDDLTINMILFSTTLNKKVKVLSWNQKKKTVLVLSNSIKMWSPLKVLRKLDSQHEQGNKNNKIKVYVNKSSQNLTHLDCRGMSLDSFEKMIEKSIYELINGEIPFLEVLHGHGEGILKKWLRTHIQKTYPELNWQNQEGNDGVTIINLKK